MEDIFNLDPLELIFIYVDPECEDLNDKSVIMCDFDNRSRCYTPERAKRIGEMLIRVAEHAHAQYTKS